MKKLMFLLIGIFFIAIHEINAKPIDMSINIGFFYTSLEPYGEWIVLDDDVIVWRPAHMDRHWRPYSHGRWSWTKYGWYWDSYEPFGWATYHYGRWYFDDYYGWIWIPDYEWGPSWVEWRYDDVYIGWAPLPPYAHFQFDFGIHFSINWHSHYSYWSFVPYDHFYHDRLNYYIVGSHLNHKIFERTKYRNNYSYDRGRIINGGLDRNIVEKRAGYRIAERDIYDIGEFDKYKRNRDSNRDRIYNYRPNEREIEKYSKKNIEVSRGDRKISFERDKIIYKNDVTYKERESKSERKKSATPERINKENIPNKDYGREIKRERIEKESNKKSNDRYPKSERNENRIGTGDKSERYSKEISKKNETRKVESEHRRKSGESKSIQRDSRSEKDTDRKLEKRR